MAKALLQAGESELVMQPRDDGFSCLNISAENGHADVVSSLLVAGGVRCGDNSCIYGSAQKGHVDVVKALLLPNIHTAPYLHFRSSATLIVLLEFAQFLEHRIYSTSLMQVLPSLPISLRKVRAKDFVVRFQQFINQNFC